MPQVQVQLKPTITTLTDQYLGRIAVAVEKIADYLVNKDKQQILGSIDMMQDIVNRIRKNNCDDCDMTQTELEGMMESMRAYAEKHYGKECWSCPAGRDNCDQTKTIVCEDCEHMAEIRKQSLGDENEQGNS